jgi:hypothetical protein
MLNSNWSWWWLTQFNDSSIVHRFYFALALIDVYVCDAFCELLNCDLELSERVSSNSSSMLVVRCDFD